MRKNRKGIEQLDIFNLIRQVTRKQAEAAQDPPVNGKASIDAAVRSLISEALKRCPLSRYDVAARMSDGLGVEITKSQLDAWSAESKENHRFPLIYTGAFCRATNDYALARYVSHLCGGYFIQSRDALYLELGRIEDLKQELAEKERLVRDFIEKTKGEFNGG